MAVRSGSAEGADDEGEASKAAPTFLQQLRANGERLAASLFTASGLLGLVTVTGAGVAWIRFTAAELPADQAVTAIRRSDLLVTGASTLIAFAALGVLAVLVAYAAEAGGRPSRDTAFALLVIAAAEIAVILGLAELSLEERVAAYLVAAAVIAVAGLVIGGVLRLPGAKVTSTGDLQRTRREEALQRQAGEERRAAWEIRRQRAALLARAARPTTAATTAAVLRGEAQALEDEAETRSRRADALEGRSVPPSRFDLSVLGQLWAFGPIVVAGACVWAFLGEWWVAAAIVAVVALGRAMFGLARFSGPTFAWYAVGVFFSVVGLGALVGMLRLADDPQVQPVALIRETDGGDEGLQGLYVTENDDEVVFGSVGTGSGCGAENANEGSGRIVSIPRDQVSSLTVGAMQGVEDAAPRARAMLRELILTQRPPRDVAAEGARSVDVAPAVRQEPSVDSVVPRTAAAGERVTVSGEGFGRHRGSVSVRDTEARVVQWTDERIVFVVPEGAQTGRIALNCAAAVGGETLVVHRAPTAAAVVVPTRRKPRRFRLVAVGSKDPDGGITGYAWKAAGQEPKTGRAVAFELPKGRDSMRVRLTVVDGDGLHGAVTVRVGRTIVIPVPADVLFCFDCRKLSPSGRAVLRGLRGSLRAATATDVLGYTDSTGTAQYNEGLSRDRAAAVARVLRRMIGSRDVDVTADGRGESFRYDNRTASGRQRNRRVEIHITRGERAETR